MVDKKLTAEEVATKRFTPVRLREGYSMDEVDAFLDQVESTLVAQESEIKELTAQAKQEASSRIPTQVPDGVSSDMQAMMAELTAAQAQNARLESDLAEARAAASAAAKGQQAGQSLAEASAASTRMLEMAAVQHDDLISQGKAASEQLVAEGREQAERLLGEAREQIAAEQERISTERSQKLGELEAEKQALELAIANLRDLETTSKAALRDHFNAKLEELNVLVVDVAAQQVAEAEVAPEADPDAVPAEEPEAVQEEPEAELAPDEEPAPTEAATELTAPDLDPAAAHLPKNFQQEYPSFYGGGEDKA